ncbi:MAG: 1,4-dihydroxy-6-naphthoate synthase [Sphingobacterium sp.]
MNLSLGFSPCPNDTFIFDALIHGKIDTGDLQFHVEYQDVETLNEQAFRAALDITKLSYHAFAYAVEDYELLDAGSALGFGVGPLLITANKELAEKLSKKAGLELEAELAKLKVGIPGKFTTANFLLGLAYGGLMNKIELLFSEIEPALQQGKIDIGLIIHENRFTYMDKGFYKILDLGEYWEKTTDSPIPLGGIVIKRSLPPQVKLRVNELIRQSVRFAFDHPESGKEYIRSHAQEMDPQVMYKHIELYVNAYTEDLGEEGKKAINRMFEMAIERNLVPATEKRIFLTK